MAWFRPHLRAHDMTDHQWRVLRALAEAETLEMQELSIVCEVHPPSLSRIVPKLVELDLIRRENDPDDQRRIVVSLTPAGRELIAKVSEGSAVIYRNLLDAVGRSELAALQAQLAELIANLDRVRLGAEAAGSPSRAAAADGQASASGRRPGPPAHPSDGAGTARTGGRRRAAVSAS